MFMHEPHESKQLLHMEVHGSSTYLALPRLRWPYESMMHSGGHFGAAANGHAKVVSALLARGADPNSQGEPQLPRALDAHAALVKKDSAGNKAAALFGGGVRGGDGVTPLLAAAA